MVLTEAACYQLLELPKGAPLDEVRRAYRALARRLHPDVQPGHEARFKRITAAYNFLMGRAKAPKASAASTQPPPPAPAPSSTPRAARPGPTARRTPPPPRARAATRTPPPPARTPAAEEAPVDHARAWAEWRLRAMRIKMEESLRGEDASVTEAPSERTGEAPAAETPAPEATAEAERCPHCGDSHQSQERPERAARKPGRGFFGRMRDRLRRPARPAPRIHARGDDVTLRLPVDLEALLNGGSRTIAVTRLAACPSCDRGGDEACVCAGVGRIKIREKVKVKVPAGARAGQKLRLAGKGTAGLDGEADGDLYLLLEPEEIPGFRREGDDLVGTIDLDPGLARRGGPLEVSVGRGKVRLTVPAGTRVGDRFRLRGQGLPSLPGGPRGDVYLVVGMR